MGATGRQGRRDGRRRPAVAVAVLAAAVLVLSSPSGAVAGPTDPIVGAVTVTLVVVGEPPPDALLAFVWACTDDTDFTTLPHTGGSQTFDMTAGRSCRFTVRDEPHVPDELFAADWQTDTTSADLTFQVGPRSVRFTVADTATSPPTIDGTVTITATFVTEPPPVPPSPPAADPVSVAPAFTG